MTAPLLEPDFLRRLEQLEIVSRKIFQGRMKGDRLSRKKGQSVEFADFRNYVVGDDLRFLDWSLLGRLDKLFIRLFQEEEDLHVDLLLDQSLSMDFGEPNKFHYARQVAAALGFIGLNSLDRVTVETFHHRSVLRSEPLRGRRSLWRLLDFLNQVRPTGAGDLTRAMREFTLRRSGKGVVILLSDFLDKGGFEEALRYLVARQVDVVVLQILSPQEIDPEFVGDLRLVDAEDADVAEVTVNAALLDRYRKNLHALRSSLATFCTRRGISYLFAPTDVPFDQLVLHSLRQRGLLR